MTSKGILIIHTTLFFLFCAGSLGSPFLYLWYPNIFSGYFILEIILLMLIVLGSWHIFGGCPFTVWENNLRKRENKELMYTGACIDHYAYQWLGIKLPRRVSTITIVCLFMIPIITWLITR